MGLLSPQKYHEKKKEVLPFCQAQSMIAAAQFRASVPFCSLPLCTLLLVGIEEEQGVPPQAFAEGLQPT